MLSRILAFLFGMFLVGLFLWFMLFSIELSIKKIPDLNQRSTTEEPSSDKLTALQYFEHCVETFTRSKIKITPTDMIDRCIDRSVRYSQHVITDEIAEDDMMP